MNSAVRFLLVIVALSHSSFGQGARFHGISAGQSLSTLPIACSAKEVFCEGLVDGYYIRVLTDNGRVLNLDVLYTGVTFDHRTIMVAPVTLAKALKTHSLQPGSATPALRYAVGNDGQTHGIVDITNRIMYMTQSTPAGSDSEISDIRVISVTYLNAKAPVLKSSKSLGFAADALLANARSAPLYMPADDTGVGEPAGASAQTNGQVLETHHLEPFGLTPGMTWNQVLSMVGSAAVKHSQDNAYILSTAPKPHPDFDEYVLLFFPPKGLVKMMAYSKTIQTNGWGQEIQRKFDEVYGAMSSKYGPGKKLDFLRSGSLWEEPKYWMMGLRKEERTLVAYWEPTPDGKVISISLAAKATSSETGQLVLTYEFDGFSDYSKSQDNKKKDVF